MFNFFFSETVLTFCLNCSKITAVWNTGVSSTYVSFCMNNKQKKKTTTNTTNNGTTYAREVEEHLKFGELLNCMKISIQWIFFILTPYWVVSCSSVHCIKAICSCLYSRSKLNRIVCSLLSEIRETRFILNIYKKGDVSQNFQTTSP